MWSKQTFAKKKTQQFKGRNPDHGQNRNLVDFLIWSYLAYKHELTWRCVYRHCFWCAKDSILRLALHKVAIAWLPFAFMHIELCYPQAH